MRLLGQILLALLVIAALQGILAVLAVAVTLLFLWGLVAHPETTAPLLVFLLVLEALDRWPLLTGSLLLATAGLVLIASRAKRAPKPPSGRVPLLAPPKAGTREG